MGAHLARHALTHGTPKLRSTADAARTVLLVMCLIAQDRHAEPFFSMGHDFLATSLGYQAGDLAGHKKVQRAVQQLRAAGLIKTEDQGPRRWKRVHRITVPHWLPIGSEADE